MRTAPPPLAPMFRSETQLKIMAEVFNSTRPYTITELAELTETNTMTAGREVRVLVECGVFDQHPGPGNSKLISPADNLAYAPELRRILAYTYGLIPAIKNLIGDDDRVEQVWIFGSWARRYHGERGHFPHDIDLIVVTQYRQLELLIPWYQLADQWRIEINTIYRHPDNFSTDDPLWANTPLVKIK